MLKSRKIVADNDLENGLVKYIKGKYTRLLNMESALKEMDSTSPDYKIKEEEMNRLDEDLSQALTQMLEDKKEAEKETPPANPPVETPEPKKTPTPAPVQNPKEKIIEVTAEEVPQKKSGISFGGVLLGVGLAALAVFGIKQHFGNKE